MNAETGSYLLTSPRSSIYQEAAEQVVIQGDENKLYYRHLFPKTFASPDDIHNMNRTFKEITNADGIKSTGPAPGLSPQTKPTGKSSMEPNLIKGHERLENETNIIWNELTYLEISADRRRFPDIKCPEHTAAHLYNNELLIFAVNNRHLHANLVSDTSGIKFFALQHPYPNDELYWTLAFGNGSVLVDLTNSNDQEFLQRQDSLKNIIYPQRQYFPESCEGGILKCGNYTIKLKDETPIIEFKDRFATEQPMLYRYEITNLKTDENRIISRIKYPNWQDHSGISPELLDILVDLVSPYQTENDRYPLINCKAGVGRTATLIAAGCIKMRMLNGPINPETRLDEINSLILNLRKERGEYCVTVDQYESLVKFYDHLAQKQL